MDREHTIPSEECLEKIRHLLSHLHGEVTVLESQYSEVLSVLKRLEASSQLDDLTGLLRRKAFFNKWNALMEECARLNESTGVLLVGIDHFKRINDTHGHPTGDEVLKRVADMLKQYESPSCIVGRYGGEEFIIAMEGSDAEILGTAEIIRKSAERLQSPVACTLSVGMASTHGVEPDATRLLQSADEALYLAKREGRNQVKAA